MAKKHKKIYLIISPPRCASTALARMFWHQPSIRYYSHEPYELVYYEGKPVSKTFNTIDLQKEYKGKEISKGNDLIVKEMSFQVGDHFLDLLKRINTTPIFLIRDPRLNISSRISKIIEAGKQKVNFPLIETGWESIEKQVNYCDKIKRKYIILESSDFRKDPDKIFRKLFKKLKLPFRKKMLNWKTAKDIKLDNLDGIQSNFYTRVLESKNIQPPTEKVPDVNEFSEKNNLRKHVLESLKIYRKLLKNPNRI